MMAFFLRLFGYSTDAAASAAATSDAMITSSNFILAPMQMLAHLPICLSLRNCFSPLQLRGHNLLYKPISFFHGDITFSAAELSSESFTVILSKPNVFNAACRILRDACYDDPCRLNLMFSLFDAIKNHFPTSSLWQVLASHECHAGNIASRIMQYTKMPLGLLHGMGKDNAVVSCIQAVPLFLRAVQMRLSSFRKRFSRRPLPLGCPLAQAQFVSGKLLHAVFVTHVSQRIRSVPFQIFHYNFNMILDKYKSVSTKSFHDDMRRHLTRSASNSSGSSASCLRLTNG